jgi:hypothetical protein
VHVDDPMCDLKRQVVVGRRRVFECQKELRRIVRGARPDERSEKFLVPIERFTAKVCGNRRGCFADAVVVVLEQASQYMRHRGFAHPTSASRENVCGATPQRWIVARGDAFEKLESLAIGRCECDQPRTPLTNIRIVTAKEILSDRQGHVDVIHHHCDRERLKSVGLHEARIPVTRKRLERSDRGITVPSHHRVDDFSDARTNCGIRVFRERDEMGRHDSGAASIGVEGD